MMNDLFFEITGIEALGKLIDAMTMNQDYYEIKVWTDDLQCSNPSDERVFMVSVKCRFE